MRNTRLPHRTTTSNTTAMPCRTTMRWIGIAVTALLLVGTAAACGDSGDGGDGGDSGDGGAGDGSPAPTQSGLDQELQASQWMLIGTDSVPAISAAAPVSLSFDDDMLSGHASCNTYQASYTVDGTNIEVGTVASTQMACDPELMDAEQQYLGALISVTKAEVTDGKRLVLTGGDDVRLTFEAQDLGAVIEGAWTITNLNTGDALSTPVEGTEPTLTFEADGTLNADAGCNPMATTWSLENGTLTIEPPRQGMKACEEPAGVMDQEAALAAALEATTAAEVTDKLTLLDEEGRMVIVAVRSTE